MECEFCKNTFSTKGNLIAHQKRSNYCLKLQNKVSDKKFICKYCNSEFPRKDNYERHIHIHESDPLLMTYYGRIKELEEMHKNNTTALQNKDGIIDELKEEIKEYKKQIERLATKAISKPTTTTYNTMNNTICVDMLRSIDHKHMKKFEHRLTPKIFTSTLYTGGAGIAKWMLDFPLKNNIFCTDTSRQKFKYKVGNKLTSDLRGRNIWKLSQDSYYEQMDKFIENEIKKIEENTELNAETKSNIITDYMATQADLYNFHIHNVRTKTEEDFSAFLTENSHTEESIIIFFEQQKELLAIEEKEREEREERSRKLFDEHQLSGAGARAVEEYLNSDDESNYQSDNEYKLNTNDLY